MKRILLFIFCSVLIQVHLKASCVYKDSTGHGDAPVTSVIIGSEYSTNTNTFGRFDNFSTQPSLSPYVSYLSKYGFDLEGIGYVIGNSDASGTETTSELDLQAGYNWELGSVFSIAPSYTHFFYSSNSSTLKKSYDDNLQLSLNSDVKWWSNSISGKYLWGDYDEINLTAQTGINITVNNFLRRNNSLIIGPLIEINFSDINYYRYISGNYKFLRAYSTVYPDATMNDLLAELKTSTKPVVRKLLDRMTTYPYLRRRLNKLAANGDLVISDLFSNKKDFKISNLGLTLPVYYYFGNFTLTGTFAAYKPFNQPAIFGKDWIAYFGVGLSYTFGNQGQNSLR
jgi:hypothetical protein